MTRSDDPAPDDIEAPRAALLHERAALAAEQLARREAEARVSGAEAMVAHLELLIAKLKHDRFGACSERGRKLLDQLELQLEKGEDVTETLEVTPRQWKVVQTVRERFTCRACESITQPPAPFNPSARAPLAAEAVRRIDTIFDVERSIDGLSAEQRLALRQTHVAALVAEPETWMRAARGKMSRHAEVARAMDYMLKRWDTFSRPNASRLGYEADLDGKMKYLDASYIDGRNASISLTDGSGLSMGDRKSIAGNAAAGAVTIDAAGNRTIAGWCDGSTASMQAGGAYVQNAPGTSGAYLHPNDDTLGKARTR